MSNRLSKGEYSQCALFATINGTTIEQEVERFNNPITPNLENQYSLHPGDTDEEVFEKLKKEYWGKNRDLHKRGEEPIKNMDEIKDWNTLMDLLIDE